MTVSDHTFNPVGVLDGDLETCTLDLPLLRGKSTPSTVIQEVNILGLAPP